MDSDERFSACAECARKCAKVHRQKSPPGHLAFFKIMIGDYKDRLIVPPKFSRLLGKFVGQNICLMNLYGCQWEVKLLKSDGCLTFQQGWNEFVSSHSIQYGEVLVFKYIDTSSFVIQIFGISGCERSHFGGSMENNILKGCPVNNAGGKNNGQKKYTSGGDSCIEDKIPSKKRKLLQSTPPKQFPSPGSYGKNDHDSQKRKCSTTVNCPSRDVRKHNEPASNCPFDDKESPHRTKTARIAIPEIPFSSAYVSKDTLADSSIQQQSSTDNRDIVVEQQTATINDSFQTLSITTIHGLDKGHETGKDAFVDVHNNDKVDPVSYAAGKKEAESQMAPSKMCANMNMDQLQPQELVHDLGNFWGEKGFIDTPTSEGGPSKVDMGGADKSVVVDVNSPSSTYSRMPPTLCSQKFERNENNISTAENVTIRTPSPTEIETSPINCLDISPICTDSLGREMLPISKSNNENPVFAYDMCGCKFLVDKEGTCHIVWNSTSDPQPIFSNSCLSKSATGNAEGEAIFAPKTKQNSFHHDTVEAVCLVPMSRGRKENLNGTLLPSTCMMADGNHAQNHHFNTAAISEENNAPSVKCATRDMAKMPSKPDKSGILLVSSTAVPEETGNTTQDMKKVPSNHAAIPQENNALSVGDVIQDISRIPSKQGKSDTPEESNVLSVGSAVQDMSKIPIKQEMKQASVLQQIEKFECHPSKPVLKSVKAEMMDLDDSSSSNLAYFCFSMVVNTLSWHELSKPLPSDYRRWRLDKKVVFLRDPSMRVWPVLYHDNLRFTGFLGGWEAFVMANNIQKGDTCHFETASSSEDTLQVHISCAAPGSLK